MKLYIPPVFQRVITSPKDILVFWGSRGGAKSESIARCIIALCLTKKGFRAFCARQTQDNKDTTLILIFQDIVNQTQGLKDKCKIFKDKIEFNNGSIIFFVGLNERTMDKAKGIKADLYWFDEAHALDRVTYRTLIPSVREKGSKVIISFNPRFEFDFVVSEFLKNPAPNVEVIQVDYRSNPFFSEKLERLRQADKAKLPYAEYKWIWENGFQPMLENAIFDETALKECVVEYDYSHSYFTRTVIGIDPATTSKDYNNETGVAVVGLNREGEAVLIEDASGHLKPSDLAKRVSELYRKYLCDAVVVEVNQGGDYLKHTLLGADSTLRVIEVRAKQDKIKRMLPIANEMYLGRLKVLKTQSEKVLEQFVKFTTNGYLGSKGESPDRAEAFAWACFELLGINEYATQGTIFKRDLLGADIGGITINSNLCFIYFEGSEYGAIVCNINDDGDYRFIFKHSLKGEVISLIEDLGDIPLSQVYANDVGFEEVLREIKCRSIELYDNTTLPIEELALKTIPLLKSSVNVLECQNFSFNGINRNWLLFDLLNFDKTNKDTFSPIVKAFCECILQIKG